MASRIHKLSSFLANQIAAGEVIERPASVLKELLENSLDAGATEIDIDVEGGGASQILLRDNGVGIHPDDLPLAVEQHSTSKIKEVSDLEGITSFGFRGEALASMGSVAKLRLQSRLFTEKVGWEVVVEGGTRGTPRPIAMLPGTLVEVRDLFFNVPARRKFLRSERTEFVYLNEWLKRIALSAFEVSFRLKHYGKLLRDFRAGNKEKRVSQIYGQAFMREALQVEIEATGLKLCGFMGSPSFVCNQASLQNLYVNGRWVRDKLILHAVKSAYPQNGFQVLSPAYLLYLFVDPTSIDVNVHPTKHEVRFREGRLIYDFVKHGLSKTMGGTGSSFETRPNSLLYPKTEPIPFPSEVLGPDANEERVIGVIGGRFLLVSRQNLLRAIDVSAFLRKKVRAELEMQIKKGAVITCPLCIPFRVSLSCKTQKELLSALEKLGFKGNLLSEDVIIVHRAPAVMKGQDVSAFLKKVCEAWLLGKIDLGKENALELLRYFEYAVEETQNAQALFEQLKKDPFFGEDASAAERRIDLVELFA